MPLLLRRSVPAAILAFAPHTSSSSSGLRFRLLAVLEVAHGRWQTPAPRRECGWRMHGVLGRGNVYANSTQVVPPLQNQRRCDTSTNRSPACPELGWLAAPDGSSAAGQDFP